MSEQARALTRQMERLIKTALMPGRFISYNAGFSFVRDLEAVERRLSKCLSANSPQAVGLWETFLAGCSEKAGDIDDSSGGFGDVVGQLDSTGLTALVRQIRERFHATVTTRPRPGESFPRDAE